MKKRIHHDVWIGLVLIGFTFTFFFLTSNFPAQSAIFPRFFLIGLLFFSIMIVVAGVKKTARLGVGENDKSELDEKETPIRPQELKLPMIGLGIILAYIVAIDTLGFFVSTTLFLVGFMLFLRIRNYLAIGLTTLGVDLFIYVLFVRQLKLTMPAGILF